MEKGVDIATLAAGVATIALGILLLLDQLGLIDLTIGFLVPALLAAAGVVLLASGLSGPGRRA
ncbi:MAG: hypothetical protein QOG62_2291 [Thermoleophilaceae bacterium]|jgi:hypothetical protein|nr:hypothetical protein [Thermoleophilaceae bacterium]